MHNMKTLLCLAALFIITSAVPYPGTQEDSLSYRAYLRMIYSPHAEIEERGDSACDRSHLNKNDVISQKFMDDHICLYRRSPPSNLEAFCRDFRQGPPIYQVMLLDTDDIKTLRNDLINHQKDFYNDREGFRPLHPGVSLYHYTTGNRYNFIFCEENRGKWSAYRKSGFYQQYIPSGTCGKPEGIYKIYHGCPPVKTCPGFRQNGNC